jgi:alkanesulfonate monooxygenase SsuD/methylene tetrahydromethanopterin reductase-like flavin-dependent oxidoreductase (luciferase family)
MDIGIGLPNPIPGLPGRTLVEWAKEAEQAGFSSLATIDRVAYPSYESLIALAAAAAVTERIGLVTNVLLGPTRSPVLLAKEAASVDQISSGRLTLGLGVGARPDDFSAAGRPFAYRGRRFDRDLELIHRAWSGEPVEGAVKPVSPRPVRGNVPILGGGTSDRAIARAVKWGIGWTAGGAGPDQAGPIADRVRQEWVAAGREGTPRIVCLQYFALGPNADARATQYLSDYYGDFGPRIATGVPTTLEALQELIQRFAAIGTDELIFDPTIGDLEQVELLAQAVLSTGRP